MATTIRKRLAVAASVLALAAGGCTTGKPSTDAPTAGPGASPTAAPGGYAGLYYDAATVSVAAGPADQLHLVGAITCNEMDAMLSAGQWRVIDRLSLPAGSAGSLLTGIVPGLLLRRGTTDAFAILAGTGDFCSATVTPVQHAGIAVTGKGFPGPSDGWAVTTTCLRTGPDALAVAVYFDTSAKVGGVVMVPLAQAGGKYTVDGHSDDLTLRLLTHTSHVLTVFGKAFSTGEVDAGVTPHVLGPGEAFSGSAVIDGSTPERPSGTFTLSGLVDSGSGAQVGLSLPFACPSVVVIKSTS